MLRKTGRKALIVVIIFVTFRILLELYFISNGNTLLKKYNRPPYIQQYTDVFKDHSRCDMHSCFDYSRCSAMSGFHVYVYSVEQVLSSYVLDEQLWSSVFHAFGQSPYFTKTPETACVYLVVVGNTAFNLEQRLHDLEFWNGDGKNHMLLNIARTSSDEDQLADADTGKAIVVQTSFVQTGFRDRFDIIIPPDIGKPNVSTWSQVPSLLPVRRVLLLSFCGTLGLSSDKFHNSRYQVVNNNKLFKQTNFQDIMGKSCANSILKDDARIIKSIIAIQNDHQKKTYVNITCDVSIEHDSLNEWYLCEGAIERSKVLIDSTFNIILSPVNRSVVSTITLQTRLFESLKYGAVPVIIGENVVLPFHELLDWSKAIVFLPKARSEDLHFYLKAINDDDILEMRAVGRMFWERYFGTTSSIIETTLAVVRTRLLIPPLAIKDEQTEDMQIARTPRINQIKTNSTTNTLSYPDAEQKHRPLLMYTHNFSVKTLRGVFNKPGDPFHLYPFNPYEHVRFPGASFKDLDGTLNGSVGETNPSEKFTAVIITYKTRRLNLLMKLLVQLKGCPYLNKVVIGWHNPGSPPTNFSWPEIGVPLIVLNRTRNSLNYRFLPFDLIDTEAILTLDDDADVTHAELVFGFGVWREHRDRLVGFAGRFHMWNKQENRWMYGSKQSCEISMILNSPSFIHKYYAYIYSYVMPQTIRDQVDEFMNCEDIAMNVLVSHITRKPPIKVTARSIFYEGSGLSSDKEHYNERHQCLNIFEKVYGYMPLLYSKHRIDYIAGNVKVPKTKKRCN